jgi:hypothetical protein
VLLELSRPAVVACLLCSFAINTGSHLIGQHRVAVRVGFDLHRLLDVAHVTFGFFVSHVNLELALRTTVLQDSHFLVARFIRIDLIQGADAIPIPQLGTVRVFGVDDPQLIAPRMVALDAELRQRTLRACRLYCLREMSGCPDDAADMFGNGLVSRLYRAFVVDGDPDRAIALVRECCAAGLFSEYCQTAEPKLRLRQLSSRARMRNGILSQRCLEARDAAAIAEACPSARSSAYVVADAAHGCVYLLGGSTGCEKLVDIWVR